MQTVILTAIYLLSCLGTGNQHCQRNGAQITGTPFCHHREHRPQFPFPKPCFSLASATASAQDRPCILVPLSPLGLLGMLGFSKEWFSHVVPGPPYLGGPPACQLAQGFSPVALGRISSFHTPSEHLFTILSAECALSHSVTKPPPDSTVFQLGDL